MGDAAAGISMASSQRLNAIPLLQLLPFSTLNLSLSILTENGNWQHLAIATATAAEGGVPEGPTTQQLLH